MTWDDVAAWCTLGLCERGYICVQCRAVRLAQLLRALAPALFAWL
ncbi:MAG TPA: hypothetical protein VEA41_09910 [Salinarimonas sp.]|nr:hypothetical protein [Salinarimonas sp.]